MAKRKWIRHMVFVACGMAVGWAYARFIGCGSSCAIRSNPQILAPYMGVIGFLLSVMTAKEKQGKEE